MNFLDQVYKEVWSVLEENSEFAELVPVRNRIKYAKLITEPQNGIGSDNPSVRIVPRAGDMNQHASSCGSRMMIGFDIQAVSGTVRIEKIFELYWAIFKAVQPMQEILESRVEWDADCSHPVARCDIVAMKADRERELSQDTGGWHTIVRLEVEMFFSTTALLTG